MNTVFPTAAPLPIACSLAGGAMADRFSQWRSLARRALAGRESHPEGAVLHYRALPGVERELRRLVALEADCCAFLAFSIEADGVRVRLTVTGPAEATPLIRDCWGLAGG